MSYKSPIMIKKVNPLANYNYWLKNVDIAISKEKERRAEK